MSPTRAVGSITVLAVTCIAVRPTWLIVSRAPQMLVHTPPDASPAPLGQEPAA